MTEVQHGHIPPTPDQIDCLIQALANAETAADAFNEYALDCPLNALRRANLRRYLRTMAERNPDTLLLMEAPGYRGCRLTGVPVTSRKLIREGLPGLEMFGLDRGYCDVNEAGFERIYGEQSATIVWGALADLGQLPLIWNAFPFHPHKLNQPQTNRRPRAAEIQLGTSFLQMVMRLWRFERVIAVGNVAYQSLGDAGIPCHKLRHPAHGGKNDFVAGLTQLLAG